ncbi:membrane protein insertion efficiency factor YidD [Candidatus Uhrbacteria bacterium]|nr:membrane protein insertion efficiency factor YidD [Candidatus Uhrbacteria bacterium]
MLPTSKLFQNLKTFAQKRPILPVKFVRKAAERLIRMYQKILSPDHGLPSRFYPYGFCRFYPSCSEYSRQAIISYGLVRGFGNAARRVLRCNPWNKGGIDVVEKGHTSEY